MKRSLFLLLLALCPLLFLIFGAFIDFWTVPPRAVPDDAPLLERVSHVNNPIRTKVARGKDFMKELAWSEVFLGTNIPSITFLREEDADFGKFRTAWDNWSQQADALQKYLSLLFRFKTKDVAQLRLAMDQVKRFRTDFSQNAPPGSAALLQLMANIESDLEHRVELAEKLREANELIAAARNDYDAQRYEPCRDTCNKLLTDFKPVLNRDVEVSLIMLKARAEVHVGEDALSEIKLDELDPVKRLEKLEAVLASMENMDEALLDDNDRQQLEAFRKEAELTRLQVGVSKQVNQAVASLANLRKNPPSSLADKIAAAAKLNENMLAVERKLNESSNTEAIQSRDEVKLLRAQRDVLKRLVQGWLVKVIPVVKSPLDDKIQEAELNDGSILSGYFRPVSEDGKVTGYKCYPTLRDFENPTIAVGTRPVADFRVPPAAPLEKKLAAQYTALREKVTKGIGSRGNWTEYHLACKKMESQLEEHKKKPGAADVKISFRNADNVGRIVLETKNWEKVEKIFR